MPNNSRRSTHTAEDALLDAAENIVDSAMRRTSRIVSKHMSRTSELKVVCPSITVTAWKCQLQSRGECLVTIGSLL